MLWSHDLIKEFNSPELLIRPVVKTGYGCSPIAYRDTIICSVGGPGQAVMAFRQDDGAVVWKSGDCLTSEAPPILIEIGGRPQLVIFGGGTVNGLDPTSGKVLWSHPHDPGNDLNCATPLFGPACSTPTAKQSSWTRTATWRWRRSSAQASLVVRLFDRHQLRFPSDGRKILRLATHR